MPITQAALDTIRVLYTAPETLSLYGIPYQMRPGQAPRDIGVGWRSDWIWLGSPGWFGSMTVDEIALVKAFLHRVAIDIPQNPHEWTKIR